MRKWFLNLIMLCILISLVGVGFATWNVIVPTEDHDKHGSFVTEEITNLIILSNSSFDSSQLRYSKSGFFKEGYYDHNSQTLISYKTYSVVNYSVDVDLATCYAEINNLKYVELRFTLIDNSDYDKEKVVSNVYEKINYQLSSDNVYSLSSLATKEQLDIYIKIPVDSSSVSTTVKIKLDFSNVVDTEYFKALSKLEKNQAFKISAALYAVYE